MDGKIVRERGRPTKDKSRRRFCGVRLDEEESEMLNHLEIEFGLNVSEIFRKALRMYYNFIISRL